MVVAGGSRVLVPARQLPASLRLRGPGQLGREGPEGILIFDAGQGGRSIDPLARFVAEEADGLDWLDDYLRDLATTSLVRELQSPAEEDVEEEPVYYKNMVTTVEMGES